MNDCDARIRRRDARGTARDGDAGLALRRGAWKRRRPDPSRAFVRGMALALVLLFAGRGHAQQADRAPEALLPELRATPRSTAIRIDGRLDEPAWAAAPAASRFVQAEPLEGGPADQPTEVRVLYDENALYVGARMYDLDPSSVARQLVRRDQEGQYDYFEVSLDADADRRTAYQFRVTAAGVQGDAYLYDDVQQDGTWDAVWESEVSFDSLGWTAELRIPLSQVRFLPSDRPQSWGINFARRRVASNEISFFALESRRRHGRVSVYGRLTDLVLPHDVRRIEVRPYVLTRMQTGPREAGNPFFDGRDGGADAGSELRYGIGSSFVLDATVNPDFGQVEVDPARINLTAFETFYPEGRPFFVEDARIFDFNLSGGSNSLFYSRRIGRAPQRDRIAGADHFDLAEQTAILGAAKLTGRTGGGLSIGALAAVTDREEARAFFPERDSVASFLAEPRAEFGVLRLQQDFGGGASQLGGILTGMHRQLPADGSFDWLPEQAFSAGVDFEHTWSDREWALWGFLAGSHLSGATDALVRVQRSSNHYFQRPGAYRLGVDSTATSMAGAEWRLQLERRSGRHWTGAVWLAERTPDFDVNDLGYFQGSERLDGGARLTYQEIEPGRWLREYRLQAVTFHNWRHEALHEPLSWRSWGHAHKNGVVSTSASLTFLNYWGLDLSAQYQPEVLSEDFTRGGPLMLRPAVWELGVGGNTDRRTRLGVEPRLSWARSTADETAWSASVPISYRPTPQVELEMGPSLEWETDAAQYVATTGDVGYAPTFGPRYLFGELEQRTFSLDTRLDATFTPSLTLQLFAQPLLSVGDFTGYKQLSRSESFEFERFAEGTALPTGDTFRCVQGRTCEAGGTRLVDWDGNGVADHAFDEQDFRVRSLRGNAVLRWEYRPGSTIFLVWQQRRSFEDARARGFDVTDEVRSLWRDRPENVLIFKVNYWLSL